MPELPDLHVYVRALEARVLGRRLERLRVGSPFLLRTAAPRPADLEGRQVLGVSRVGKRIVFGLDGELFAVFHLMIAGRLHWRPAPAKDPGKSALCTFAFEHGLLWLTEASSKKRASLYLVRGEAAVRALDRGGVEVLPVDLGPFREALTRENHTLKRALTDPRLFAGIGNAYSDEILHRAGLSPVTLTSRLTAEQIERLHAAVQRILREWTERLEREAGDGFPEKVTAFRPEMAVHGKYGQPCPKCSTPVARLVYAENEANYCPTCQTGGRLLADRALSRLLKGDWPRSVQELEEHLAARRQLFDGSSRTCAD